MSKPKKKSTLRQIPLSFGTTFITTKNPNKTPQFRLCDLPGSSIASSSSRFQSLSPLDIGSSQDINPQAVHQSPLSRSRKGVLVELSPIEDELGWGGTSTKRNDILQDLEDVTRGDLNLGNRYHSSGPPSPSSPRFTATSSNKSDGVLAASIVLDSEHPGIWSASESEPESDKENFAIIRDIGSGKKGRNVTVEKPRNLETTTSSDRNERSQIHTTKGRSRGIINTSDEDSPSPSTSKISSSLKRKQTTHNHSLTPQDRSSSPPIPLAKRHQFRETPSSDYQTQPITPHPSHNDHIRSPTIVENSHTRQPGSTPISWTPSPPSARRKARRSPISDDDSDVMMQSAVRCLRPSSGSAGKRKAEANRANELVMVTEEDGIRDSPINGNLINSSTNWKGKGKASSQDLHEIGIKGISDYNGTGQGYKVVQYPQSDGDNVDEYQCGTEYGMDEDPEKIFNPNNHPHQTINKSNQSITEDDDEIKNLVNMEVEDNDEEILMDNKEQNEEEIDYDDVFDDFDPSSFDLDYISNPVIPITTVSIPSTSVLAKIDDPYPLTLVSDLPEALREFYRDHWRRGADRDHGVLDVGEKVDKVEGGARGKSGRGLRGSVIRRGWMRVGRGRGARGRKR